MSIKQDWQRERQFMIKGRLTGMITQLRSIMASNTILPSEVILLKLSLSKIQSVLDNYDLHNTKTLSFEQYKMIILNRRWE